MTEKKHIEHRLRRLVGMSPEKIEAMHKAQGAADWWARCWNCKKHVQMQKDMLEHADCPHCGVNLWKRG